MLSGAVSMRSPIAADFDEESKDEDAGDKGGDWEDEESVVGYSWWAPHPASASQLSRAAGSQPCF